MPILTKHSISRLQQRCGVSKKNAQTIASRAFKTGITHTETHGNFFSVSAANIVSKWMGESERLIKGLFDLARKNKPAVIFLDEIDSVMGARSDNENDATRR